MFKKCAFLFAALFAVSSLSGCGSAKQAFGLTRTSPDEFTVIARAPLTVPPDFELRPPVPGTVRPQEETIADKAKNALLASSRQLGPNATNVEKNQKTVLKQGSRTRSEMLILQKASASEAMPDIRKIVNEENTRLTEESKDFADKLIFWRDTKDPTAVLVDADKETKRLQENMAMGDDATKGETPIIERDRKGFLEDAF